MDRFYSIERQLSLKLYHLWPGLKSWIYPHQSGLTTPRDAIRTFLNYRVKETHWVLLELWNDIYNMARVINV